MTLSVYPVMAPSVSCAEILYWFADATELGVTVNVAVDSLVAEIGPMDCGPLTVQPDGTLSLTEPCGRVPDPDLVCTVTWKESPATLKNLENVSYSSEPVGIPPGSCIVAPKNIDLSRPAFEFRVPSGLTFGWNGTKDSFMPNVSQAGLATCWNMVRLCVA